MVAMRTCLSGLQLLGTLKEADVSEGLEVVLWNPHSCLADGLLSGNSLPMTEHGQDTQAGMQLLRDETPLMSNYGLRTNQLPCLTFLRTSWQSELPPLTNQPVNKQLTITFLSSFSFSSSSWETYIMA